MNTYAPFASKRFNIDLENSLLSISEDIKAILGNNFEALVLGGGYGRGEGAVQIIDNVEYGYNDLDLVLIVKNKYSLPKAKLEKLTDRYSKELNIDVDLSRPLTIKDIRNWSHWLMWHDIVHGHVVLMGDNNIIELNAPDYIRTAPPTIEATRLLLNRGSGLLWSLMLKKGNKTLPDPDFIRRNYYKCLLSLGDALLITKRMYTTSYFGRGPLFDRVKIMFPDLPVDEISYSYMAALDFRFFPDKTDNVQPDLHDLNYAIGLWQNVFLSIESLRTGVKWESIYDYCNDEFIREIDKNKISNWPGNAIHNLNFGRISLKYPREQLYQMLPRLLNRKTHDDHWSDISQHYLSQWHCYN